MKPILGILLGEATGIGPEIVAKMCAQGRFSPYCKPVIIGDIRVLKLGQKIAGVDFPIKSIKDLSNLSWEDAVPVLDQNNLDPAGINLGVINAESGRITGDMIITALYLCKKNAIAGFVFAPFNKAALKYGGYDFEDEHRMMAYYLKWHNYHGEINVTEDVWTSRVTSHIPLKSVSDQITKEKIIKAIELAHDTLKKAGYNDPKIAVSALNPHAGEDGSCGREEIEVITPAVIEAGNAGINVKGPFSADTLFIQAFNREYDAVTTMYHDQGQIAIKLKNFRDGVTVAAGLPYPITTPAHGTAFDIVGKGIANIDAMEKAVIIAAKMAGRKE